MKNRKEYLKDLNTFLRTADNQFRTRVCCECGWSDATYYRKLQPGKVLSPVEFRAIQEISKDLANKLIHIATNSES